MDMLVWVLAGFAVGAFPATVVLVTLTGRRGLLTDANRSAWADADRLLVRQGAGLLVWGARALEAVKAAAIVAVAAAATDPYATAACGLGVVAGSCWPPIAWRLAGRGVWTALGVSAVLFPVESALLGAVCLLIWIVRRVPWIWSLAILGIPIAAMLRGQPGPYLVTAWAAAAMIVARRLEGIASDLRDGETAPRAAFRRVIADREPRPAPNGHT